jgi:hypothetical protein
MSGHFDRRRSSWCPRDFWVLEFRRKTLRLKLIGSARLLSISGRNEWSRDDLHRGFASHEGSW